MQQKLFLQSAQEKRCRQNSFGCGHVPSVPIESVIIALTFRQWDPIHLPEIFENHEARRKRGRTS